MGLQWVSQFCSQAKFVLKQDDDIVVDYFQFVTKLEDQYAKSLSEALVGFKQMGLRPQRNPKSKWFVSKEDYPLEEYPDFLSGWAFATTPWVAGILARLSRDSKFFWIDDIWITGILAWKANFKLLSLNSLYTMYVEHIECCVKNPSQTRGEFD